MKVKFCLLILLFSFSSFAKLSVSEEMSTDYSNWMQNLLINNQGKEISLKDICIPRAHDAGMYELNHCVFGNACNTKTQEFSMAQMLEKGIRAFDIRPVKRNKKFFTFHKTKCKGLGCNGANLETILKETKDFLDEHNELVIFEITHFCKTSATDQSFLAFLENHLGDRIYKEASSDNIPFIHKNLRNILNDESNKGKVILLMSSLNEETENKEKGFFKLNHIAISGSYANKYEHEKMKEDQLRKFKEYKKNNSSLFKLCWALTLDTKLSIDCYSWKRTSIKELAEKAILDLPKALKNWKSQNSIQKGQIPNIISVDYANELVTKECIKISKFNLE